MKRATWADDTDSDVDEVTGVGLGFVFTWVSPLLRSLPRLGGGLPRVEVCHLLPLASALGLIGFIYLVLGLAFFGFGLKWVGLFQVGFG